MIGTAPHGYSLEEIDALVRRGILRNPWYQAIDADERYATGWHAAVELLYTSDVPPAPRDLIHAAWYAADTWTCRDAEAHGVGRSRSQRDAGRTDAPRFHAYWFRHSVGAVDDLVVERIALGQIWPQLSPTQQQAFQALAAYEDYRAAADALGVEYRTFCNQIRRARARFDELWMEGETPRKRWRDKRIHAPGGQRSSLSTHIRRRRRAAVPIEGAAS